MPNGELAAEIDSLFNPEVDEDSSPREFPHTRLVTNHGFNFDFMEGFFDWEGSTSHPNTRICPSEEKGVGVLIKNSDVPLRLFEAALRVYGDSLVSYAEGKEHNTALRFYPPVILTFWSAFEAFVRHTSAMMLLTSAGIPAAVSDYLREVTPVVNRKGNIELKTRFQPVLDRYAVFLRYGFDLDIDRGNKYWQGLEQAKELRDYYTHVEATNSRSLSDAQVLEFLEAVLLGVIWPSAQAKRTLLIGVHHLYAIWARLADLTAEDLATGHIEEPFFHSWQWEGTQFMFYCPFTGVDADRFPNRDEEMDRDSGE